MSALPFSKHSRWSSAYALGERGRFDRNVAGSKSKAGLGVESPEPGQELQVFKACGVSIGKSSRV